MDVDKEGGAVGDEVLVLGGDGERSGHISRLRQTKSRSRPCNFPGLREGKHDLQKSAVGGEVSPTPVVLRNLPWGSGFG